MAFEFEENVSLYLPEVNENIKRSFTEAEDNAQKLIIEIAAIHAGLTSNYNMYPEEELAASLKSWVEPYPKPIIINHDPESDPLGRVMAARMDREEDGTAYARLQIAVMSPDAIKRVMDERFMTGSVGGKANTAHCSICETDWASPTAGNGLPCKHQRGKIYNGKLAFFKLGGLSWKEYSFVNMPADQHSGIRPNSSEESGNDWVKSAKFFSVDMNKESIIELNDNDSPVNILESMKKKDAHYTYMNVKGTFLTASAYDYKENINSKENENITFDNNNTTIDNELSIKGSADVSKENEMSTETETEDILSVAEQLSADLASEDATADSESDSTETTSEASSEGSDKETDTEESEVETKDQGEESDSEEQLSNESHNGVEEQAKEESEETTEETKEEEESVKENEEDSRDAQIESLKTENTKLKNALHHMLAERVVDAKVTLGIIESAARNDALKEHASRSASSLADSIRDLEKLSQTAKINLSSSSMPSLTEKILSITDGDEKTEVVEENQEVSASTKQPTAEEKAVVFFSEALLGHKRL